MNSPVKPANLGSLAGLFSTVPINSPFDPNDPKKSKQDRYRHLLRGINVVSYSTITSSLNSCERYFALSKLQQAAVAGTEYIETLETNIDLTYGKCIESGVQAMLMGKSREQIFWAMLRAWDMPLLTIHPKGYRKTFVDATLIFDRFLWHQQNLLGEWELVYFHGKPAIELAILIDLGNGYYYVLHPDAILRHKTTGKYRILEIKTTAKTNLHEAMYQNSDQALGYSIVLDSIAEDKEKAATFEVFYLVFDTYKDEPRLFEFTKSRKHRAGWINTIFYDIQRINLCRQTGFWPKRGDSCFKWNRPCKYLSTCDLDMEHFNSNGFAFVGEEELNKHPFDFRFSVQDIIKTQEELL